MSANMSECQMVFNEPSEAGLLGITRGHVISCGEPHRFTECMVKIGLEYLSYHGNLTQQAVVFPEKLSGGFVFLEIH